MGRTVPSYRDVIDDELQTLRKYRSALRKEDQALFDEMMSYAKFHISASSYSSRLNPFESIILNILLEQQRQIRELTGGEKLAMRKVLQGRQSVLVSEKSE
ncbi:MAG: hypothetical protein ABH863_05685 [Candidatus Micrarchaeota archaeon]